MNPKYPVYIISKGRHHNCITEKQLNLMNVPYKVVIESQEYDDYAKTIDSNKLLVLPFSNLNQGSIPARNWVWEHSISIGAKRHWILDDNIEAFYRLNRNIKTRVTSGTIFKCIEDFTDRYTNIPIAGMNYASFCKSTDNLPPIYLNTRVYSCILIDNTLSHKWRGRYNEDTDLCLRVLIDGNCTVLFNAFLAGKVTTLRMKGGNTDNVYIDEDNRMKFAKSLQEQHPKYVQVVWKFKRWHHKVNYKPFKKNKPVLKDNVVVPDRVNNYGMKLIELEDN